MAVNAEEILAILTFLQSAAPEIVSLIKNLTDKLTGQTADQIATLTHAINAVTLKEINDELDSKKPQ